MTADVRGDSPPAAAGMGRTTHVFFAACAAGCVAFVAWASVQTLDIVSTAQGEVTPSTQVKSIQHLEGGIVREIAVREGERVTQGQPLVSLEPTVSGADVGEIEVRISSLRIDIARLETESAGKDRLVFSRELATAHPDLAKYALEQFETRRRTLDSRIAGQKETITQRDHAVKEIAARIKNQRDKLVIQEEQVAISDGLLESKLTSRYSHLDVLKGAAELRGRIEEDTDALAGATAAGKAARAELATMQSEFVQKANVELDEARVKLKELTQRIQKYHDSFKRTVLRAPVDGIVKTLHVATIGGVVKPGETVIDIVPGEDLLIVEARLPPRDIGYVQVGQKAVVKLASADAMRFDGLDGRVIHVSPDTLVTREGQPFYKVRIATERDYFRRGEVRYSLHPGMQVVASIQTGERTVLQYLIDPLFNSYQGALTER